MIYTYFNKRRQVAEKLNRRGKAKYIMFDIFDYGRYTDGFLYIIKCYYEDENGYLKYDLKIGKGKEIEIFFKKYCAMD